MDDRIKRNKLVNFRVSEEEFSQITQAAHQSGARSVSMFARAAVLTPRASPSGVAPIEDHLCQIDRRLEALFSFLGSPVASADSRDEVRMCTAAAGATR